MPFLPIPLPSFLLPDQRERERERERMRRIRPARSIPTRNINMHAIRDDDDDEEQKEGMRARVLGGGGRKKRKRRARVERCLKGILTSYEVYLHCIVSTFN